MHLKNQFLFNGVVYDQMHGIAMGSPLTPTLANLSMVTMKRILEEFEWDVIFVIEDTLTTHSQFSKS